MFTFLSVALPPSYSNVFSTQQIAQQQSTTPIAAPQQPGQAQILAAQPYIQPPYALQGYPQQGYAIQGYPPQQGLVYMSPFPQGYPIDVSKGAYPALASQPYIVIPQQGASGNFIPVPQQVQGSSCVLVNIANCFE